MRGFTRHESDYVQSCTVYMETNDGDVVSFAGQFAIKAAESNAKGLEST